MPSADGPPLKSSLRAWQDETQFGDVWGDEVFLLVASEMNQQSAELDVSLNAALHIALR